MDFIVLLHFEKVLFYKKFLYIFNPYIKKTSLYNYTTYGIISSIIKLMKERRIY